jgi:4-coumarate--CoA ligase
LVYSSGTTGLPKGVMLTHSNIVANSRQFLRHDAKFLNWDMDAQLGVLPFFHIYGLSVVVNMTLATGAKCVVMAKFDLPKACQLIQDHSISFLYVPPPIVLALGKEPIVDKYDLSSLRFINSGAAPLSKHLVEAVWNRLRIGVKQGYGLSETSPTTHAQQIDEFWKYQGSVGRLVANMQAKLVDADGKEVPRGEAGEILLKGPNVFGGYWRRPELNKDAFTEDGWYRTGDVGYADRKGNFYITDRIKELIKYKGFQVPPAELEEILVGREDVADACVIGVYDEDRASEVPRAYVVLKEGVAESDALATELVEYVAGKVAPPKRLRGGLRFSKEIPKSASGKILRRVLIDKVRKEEGAAPKAKL